MSETLTEAGRQALKEYHRQYRKTHTEAQRDTRIRYWNKKGEQLEADNGRREEAEE